MNEFVERCTAEWQRLGVPEGPAQEMASDLASDLKEAAVEGISTEAYLGASAADPRAFARSWALERGIIPSPPPSASGRRTPRSLLAFTAVSVVTVIATAVLLVTGQPKLAIAASRATAPGVVRRTVVHSTTASAPVEWVLLVLAIAAVGFAAWLWSTWRRGRPSAAA